MNYVVHLTKFTIILLITSDSFAITNYFTLNLPRVGVPLTDPPLKKEEGGLEDP